MGRPKKQSRDQVADDSSAGITRNVQKGRDPVHVTQLQHLGTRRQTKPEEDSPDERRTAQSDPQGHIEDEIVNKIGAVEDVLDVAE
jgi:hypothetical protein